MYVSVLLYNIQYIVDTQIFAERIKECENNLPIFIDECKCNDFMEIKSFLTLFHWGRYQKKKN
jgi:hypothetical protein